MSEELDKLEELFKNGFILQEEFDSRKHQLQSNKKSAKNNATSIPFDIQQLPEQLAIIPQLITMMSLGVSQQATLEAVSKVRMLLSVDRNPPIEAVVASGGVPILVKLLGDSNEEIKFQATWALSNVASGSSETTEAVIQAGAVPPLIVHVASGSPKLQEQAVWALGNISGDSVGHRDFLIDHNALPTIVHALEQSNNLSLYKTGIWALSNFCRGKPAVPLFHLADVIKLMAKAIFNIDQEVVTDACFALSYISDGPLERVTAVVSSGVVPKLLEYLSHPSSSIVTPALRTLGNIISGDDTYTSMLLNHNLISFIPQLLAHPKKIIKKEACWLVSNITAGDYAQIQAVIEGNLIPPIISKYKQENWDTKKEILWVIINALLGNVQQVKYFVEQGCIGIMVDMLTPPTSDQDPKDKAQWDMLLPHLLAAFKNLCKAGDQIASTEHIPNPAPHIIEQAGGVNKIREFMSHNDEAVREEASSVLGYFST